MGVLLGVTVGVGLGVQSGDCPSSPHSGVADGVGDTDGSTVGVAVGTHCPLMISPSQTGVGEGVTEAVALGVAVGFGKQSQVHRSPGFFSNSPGVLRRQTACCPSGQSDADTGDAGSKATSPITAIAIAAKTKRKFFTIFYSIYWRTLCPHLLFAPRNQDKASSPVSYRAQARDLAYPKICQIPSLCPTLSRYSKVLFSSLAMLKISHQEWSVVSFAFVMNAMRVSSTPLPEFSGPKP